jgi:hypothetical protein
MTMTRKDNLKLIRRLIRGLGVIKRVHLMTLAELRIHGHRLVVTRQDWFAAQDMLVMVAFLREDSDYATTNEATYAQLVANAHQMIQRIRERRSQRVLV